MKMIEVNEKRNVNKRVPPPTLFKYSTYGAVVHSLEATIAFVYISVPGTNTMRDLSSANQSATLQQTYVTLHGNDPAMRVTFMQCPAHVTSSITRGRSLEPCKRGFALCRKNNKGAGSIVKEDRQALKLSGRTERSWCVGPGN
ncbi:hypothetical protein PoB_004800800 [Plakobranchus ocellatus]|uniref:Uncharacterized protein n=1 Tax=Plakobranchus ocellatus TaxID=259542 RepID=A0AAV4BPK1_9GAST|nr:hypothetical protein PoB_004800800 [Plakobranchus ocellatus]